MTKAKMKKDKNLITILIVSLFLSLIVAASYHFKGSFALFAFAGVVFAMSFSMLTELRSSGDEKFEGSLRVSPIFSTAALLFISFLIATKSLANIREPLGANTGITYAFAVISCIVMLVCFIMLLKENKKTALKFLFAAVCSAVVIAQTAIGRFEFHLSLLFAAVIFVISVFNIKRAVSGN